MRKIDFCILLLGAIVAILWATFSSRDGFKGNDATIVARSIAITATIDGQVENKPPDVGAWVENEELLARVYNGRIDRSRLIEFESQIAYLESEIKNIEDQLMAIESLKGEFEQRGEAYARWRLQDLQLGHSEATAQLQVARARKQLEEEEVDRNQQLYAQNLISEVEMRITQTQAKIAGSELALNKAHLSRTALVLETMKTDGVFFSDGDTSYWQKMTDTLAIRQFDSQNRIALLEFQLTQARAQARAEKHRIDSSFAEEHRAPFTGMISARFVTESTRVTSGTTLLQLLDCTRPVVIIPIPDHNTSQFSIGQRVTVYPIDSDRALPGRISYISSGPMIGSDTSIQIQEAVVLDGNRAIVSLEGNPGERGPSESCETARKAVAVIHTDSFFNTFFDMFQVSDAGALEASDPASASAGPVDLRKLEPPHG